ncbi:MAG TPA: OmpA family protein [Cytophagaceae bacterium]
MKNFFILPAIIALLLFAKTSYAQNPEHSKKMQKIAKKNSHKHHDPYKIEWHDKDDDGDGIPNGRDKCIHTPKGEPVTPFGCPFDTDFDGLYDYQDSCKTEPGPHENYGCPYRDKDNDGIADNKDKCPDVPGITKFHGCPDTDGDGIVDNEDNCPKERGTLAYHGCPPPFIDSDKDGISDYDDLCPHTPGIKANKGCPEVKPEEKAILKKAYDNLLFESGKDVIVSSSFASLDDLAKYLINNPKLKIHLEGHTDNVGHEQANMDLSQRRALAVKNYLVSKGIFDYNILTEGYGSTRPIATNDSEEGRHKNRRVEMTVLNH